MKLTLIALAAMAAAPAFAQNVTTSTVGGGVAAFSTGNGNSFSTHAATSAAFNSSTASGGAMGAGSVPLVGTLGPYYQASATANGHTEGGTLTTASGIGHGSATSAAEESGAGTSTQSANAIKPAITFLGHGIGNGGTVGNASATSNAQVGTGSNATVTNSGLATSGTFATASNHSAAVVNAAVPGTSAAAGFTSGHNATTTFSDATHGDDANAFGTLTVGPVTNVGSFNSGMFSGTITRP